jgi:hypothetical protein
MRRWACRLRVLEVYGELGAASMSAIAARETRIAARRRAVQHAYRMSIERDAALMPPHRSAIVVAVLVMRPGPGVRALASRDDGAAGGGE